jgi:DNA-binding transcriptional MocR family regulator
VLVDPFRKVFGDTCDIHGAEAGMHLTAAFGVDRDDVGIATQAAAQGLWLWPLSANYATRHDRKGFILGYGNVGLQAIPAAVEKLRIALGRG